MLSAYLNSWKIPELRKRIVFTFGIILLCRVTANIPVPGVDASALAELFGSQSGGGVMDMFNLFSGGALEKFAVGALGIMPYISASIIMQLLTPVIPTLEKMVREGEAGRQQYNQISRYVTVGICIIQGGIFAKAMSDPGQFGISGGASGVVLHPGFWFMVRTIITLTAGALFIMWLGEMITERGIGNGASLIITINILGRLPGSMVNLYTHLRSSGGGASWGFFGIRLLGLLAMFLLICAATIALTQGMRRIPIRYAKRSSGRGGAAAGSTSYLPLRVNYAGVMPIIFGGAIMMFPTMLARWAASNGWPPAALWSWLAIFLNYGDAGYLCCYGALILAFSFFWVANQFNPIQIADDLQKRGGYVPGIRPGNPTADYLDHTMTRITVAGSVFLLAIAVLPMFLSQSFKIPSNVAQFYGGTSLLIVVGVTLDTMRQVEAHLLSRHYDGFLSKGRLRSRRG
jgi:preprotein translocase subunit SecY